MQLPHYRDNFGQPNFALTYLITVTYLSYHDLDILNLQEIVADVYLNGCI